MPRYTQMMKQHSSVKEETGEPKVETVMHEYKEGNLHSGSKKGPVVKNRKQAVAIALNQAGLSNKGK